MLVKTDHSSVKGRYKTTTLSMPHTGDMNTLVLRQTIGAAKPGYASGQNSFRLYVLQYL